MIGFTVVVLFILGWLISGGAGGSLSVCGIFGMVSAQQDVLASCHGILNSSVNGIGLEQSVLHKCQTLDVPAAVIGVQTYDNSYDDYKGYSYNFGCNSSAEFGNSGT